MVLERIQKENDIQKIAKEDLPTAQEIREFLVEKISAPGEHPGLQLRRGRADDGDAPLFPPAGG